MPTKSNLELRQQVGQLLIMGFDGTAISARLRSMLGTLQPGGVILFKRNIEEAAQTHALLRQCAKGGPTAHVPVRGHGRRHGRSPARCDRAGAVGCRSGRNRLEETVPQAWTLIGEEVRALGFNTDFAPVARPAVRAVEERADLANRFRRSQRDDRLRARVSARLAAMQAFSAAASISPDWARPISTRITSCPSIDKPWKACGTRTCFPIASCAESCRS